LQRFCFLKTKDHFSSSWASWVEGGKGHEFVVTVPGVAACLEGVANNGVFIDSGQSGSLADATTVLEVLKDIECLVVRESAVEQGGAFAFGEAGLAGAAGKHSPLVLAITEADTKIALATQAVVGALWILTAEQIKVFHEANPHSKLSGPWTILCQDYRNAVWARQHYGDTTEL
jgi:hypothetical protein